MLSMSSHAADQLFTAGNKQTLTFLAQQAMHSILQDDFKITKKIATGGFGTVYRAELDDGKTPGGRPVIIKKVGMTGCKKQCSLACA